MDIHNPNPLVRGTPFSLLDSANSGRIHLPSLQQVKLLYLNLSWSPPSGFCGEKQGDLEHLPPVTLKDHNCSSPVQTLPKPGEGVLPQHPPIPSFYQPVGVLLFTAWQIFGKGASRARLYHREELAKKHLMKNTAPHCDFVNKVLQTSSMNYSKAGALFR